MASVVGTAGGGSSAGPRLTQAGPDVEASDDWLVERGMFVYDALHAWCRRQTGPDGSS